MANRRRGEVNAELDGKPVTLCLTLGALAELEDAFNVENLADLTKRFSSGNLSARDLLKILGCGLRGGGHTYSDDELTHVRTDGGAAGFAEIVAQLLEVSFSDLREPETGYDARESSSVNPR